MSKSSAKKSNTSDYNSKSPRKISIPNQSIRPMKETLPIEKNQVYIKENTSKGNFSSIKTSDLRSSKVSTSISPFYKNQPSNLLEESKRSIEKNNKTLKGPFINRVKPATVNQTPSSKDFISDLSKLKPPKTPSENKKTQAESAQNKAEIEGKNKKIQIESAQNKAEIEDKYNSTILFSKINDSNQLKLEKELKIESSSNQEDILKNNKLIRDYSESRNIQNGRHFQSHSVTPQDRSLNFNINQKLKKSTEIVSEISTESAKPLIKPSAPDLSNIFNQKLLNLMEKVEKFMIETNEKELLSEYHSSLNLSENDRYLKLIEILGKAGKEKMNKKKISTPYPQHEGDSGKNREKREKSQEIFYYLEESARYEGEMMRNVERNLDDENRIKKENNLLREEVDLMKDDYNLMKGKVRELEESISGLEEENQGLLKEVNDLKIYSFHMEKENREFSELLLRLRNNN